MQNSSKPIFSIPIRALFTATIISLMLSGSAAAHHSFHGVFDLAKPLDLQGTVVSFEFVNPHGWVMLDAKMGDGSVHRYKIEVANPNQLLRMGWKKDSLKPGDMVSVSAFAARANPDMALGREFTLADGRKVLSGGPPNPALSPTSDATP